MTDERHNEPLVVQHIWDGEFRLLPDGWVQFYERGRLVRLFPPKEWQAIVKAMTLPDAEARDGR